MLNRKVFVGVLAQGLLVALTVGQVIQIEDGLILGREMESRSGATFNAFLGIPFARPPIGELRFRAPVRNEPWDGILNCTTFGPVCMQAGAGAAASEDCLHLNVFTKNLPSNQTDQLKPVIVYIHGGGFEVGSAAEHGAEYLMDRDVVFVTVQYRLSAFGFMAVGRADVTGNQGLKDQTLSFRWVQENIHHFGGDRNRVTIGGHSAGSFSVTAHMVSPMSQGLFHRVIGLSGSIASGPVDAPIKRGTTNTVAVMELAKRVNCTTISVDGMVDCLRNTSAQVIAQNMIIEVFPCLVLAWTPLIEDDFGQERFLTDDPSVLFRQGNFSRVSTIAGITDHEFIAPAANVLGDPTATAYLNENWASIAPICFFFEGNEFTSTEEMATAIRESYFPFNDIDIRSFNNLNNLFGDSLISYGVHKFVHLVNTFIDVYYYKFSYVGQFSVFNFPRNRPYGVHHEDDIQYVFNLGRPGSVAIPLGHPDSFVVERMTRIWEQFAWTGNPNKQNDEYLDDMLWPRYNSTTESYLEIGNHLVEKNGLFLERFTMWDNFEANSTTFRPSNSTPHNNITFEKAIKRCPRTVRNEMKWN
ncbi:esterase E4-like isoform X2 [Bradysia coprophila]|uniref:esterase E4-like isoform X2 n=1 Tax=Bradysia coprophila TaxID=38358 RepID=UPI00187DAD6D|nr:esterase E4-like isoform X2 [Bradysia coprophila]